MKSVSPPLMRLCGCLGFSLFGLGSFCLGNKIQGLNLDIWSSSFWSDLGVGGVVLLVVSFFFSFIGMFVGLSIATQIKVVSEKADFIISSFWHYLANGSMLWVMIWVMYLTKTIGKENAREFMANLGLLPKISMLLIPVIGYPLIAGVLLLFGLLNERHKPMLLPCLIPSIPIAMGMGYVQLHLLGIVGYVWIVIGIIIPIILIPFCTFMITRDKFQRQQIINMQIKKESSQ